MFFRLAPLAFLCLIYSAQGQEKKTFEQRAIDTGDQISEKVQQAAEKIDITLAGKKYTKKPNPSHAEIRQLVTYSEGGKIKTSTDFGLNLRLPNVEKRWQLRFTSYDEEKESRDLTQQRVRTQPRERNYGAGLFFFERLGRVKTSFQPRLQLKNPLEVSYILRFETEGRAEPVKITPRLDLFADPQKAAGEFTSLQFQMDLTDKLELTLQNTEEYRGKENFFTTQHGISIDYSLSDTRAVGAAVTFVSNNHPQFHLHSFTVSTAYTQQIYPERLSYSITPFLDFAKNVAFKGNAGISLSIDLTF